MMQQQQEQGAALEAEQELLMVSMHAVLCSRQC